MNLFTYITGIASLIGLVLQIKDVFPKYKNLRQSLLFLIIGMCFGTILGGIQLLQLNLFLPEVQSTGEFLKTILVCAAILMVFILVIAGIFTNGHEGYFVFAVFLSFFLIPIVSSMNTTKESEKISNLNIGDLKLLEDHYEKNENYERCIIILEEMKSELSRNDPRKKVIIQKIDEIKMKQIGIKHNP
ncbi:MAG: hypothetical protein A2Y10_14265 [Planctomycetes bacterium GWF2_41_51]|nr:MAG: hypothetical protein A2Y10_14265 [Planctomycetes bacterium GWF2_41_51]